MTKAEIIRLIVCKVKDYRFTHDEMLKMSKEEILKYYPQLGREGLKIIKENRRRKRNDTCRIP